MNNKNVKPFHLFNHQSNWFMINIEEMHSKTIYESSAKTLKKIIAKPDKELISLDSSDVKILNNLGLIEEADKNEKENKNECFPIINMSLFVTQSCNLKCIYCYGEGGRYGAGGSLKEDTALRAVDWLIDKSGRVKKIHIGFFGGEPFLNFPIMKTVAEYALKRIEGTDKNISFHLTTNATLLDDEKISFIEKYKVSVSISFDGPKEIQDFQRPFLSGKGSYDTTVPKIKNLLKIFPKTPGHAVIMGDTKPDLVKKALKNIGFSETSVTLASESLFSNKTHPNRNLNEMLKSIENESNIWLSHIKDKDNKILKELIENSQLYQPIISFLHNSKRHYPCGAGLGLVAISCSGDIFLCHRFVGMGKYKLGNIFNNNFNRGKYQESPLNYIEKCSTCFAKYYCSGACKHDNVASCGSIYKPSEDMCRLKRRELELAAYITSNLNNEDRCFLVEQNIFPQKPCPFDFL